MVKAEVLYSANGSKKGIEEDDDIGRESSGYEDAAQRM